MNSTDTAEPWAGGRCASFKGRHAVGIIAQSAINQPVFLKMASASSIAASIASKTKTKKKHFVAQKVKLFRASDPLLSVVMWGVNHSVSQTVHCHWWSTVMSPSIFWCSTLRLTCCQISAFVLLQLNKNTRWQLSSGSLNCHRKYMTGFN